MEGTVPCTHCASAGTQGGRQQVGRRRSKQRTRHQVATSARAKDVTSETPSDASDTVPCTHNRANARAGAPRQPTSTHNTARAEEKRDEKEGKERWKVKGRGRKRQGEGEEKENGKDGRRGQEGEARRESLFGNS